MKYLIRKILDNITAFALARLIVWEICEHDFNLAYNPIGYPIFSILWLYFRIGKKLTKDIKRGKIYDVKHF